MATEPQTALSLLAGEQVFDAVLTDVRLPGMTGLELHASLRDENPGLADRVVFMTGDTLAGWVSAGLSGLDNPVLVKPFRLRELSEILDRLVPVPNGSNSSL